MAAGDEPAPPGLDGNEYIVQEGDTLSGLALRLDTTERNLKRVNRLTSTSLYAGQRLTIPAPRPLLERAHSSAEAQADPADVSLEAKGEGQVVEVVGRNG